MSNRRKSKSSRAAQSAVGIAVWLAIGLLTVPAAIFTLTHETPHPDKRGCLKDRTPPMHTQVLLDATDPYDVAAVERALLSETQKLPRHGRLDLYVLDKAAPVFLRLEVSVCNPGHRDDADPLTENPDRLQQVFEQQVVARIRAVAANLKDRRENRSPIIEALAELPRFEPAPVQRLVLISDGLQNSALANLYRGRSAFAALKLDAAHQADFQGIAPVFYLQRQTLGHSDEKIQQHPWFREFWRSYFTAMNALPLEFKTTTTISIPPEALVQIAERP